MKTVNLNTNRKLVSINSLFTAALFGTSAVFLSQEAYSQEIDPVVSIELKGSDNAVSNQETIVFNSADVIAMQSVPVLQSIDFLNIEVGQDKIQSIKMISKVKAAPKKVSAAQTNSEEKAIVFKSNDFNTSRAIPAVQSLNFQDTNPIKKSRAQKIKMTTGLKPAPKKAANELQTIEIRNSSEKIILRDSEQTKPEQKDNKTGFSSDPKIDQDSPPDVIIFKLLTAAEPISVSTVKKNVLERPVPSTDPSEIILPVTV